MFLTAIAYVLIAALGLVVLGIALLPVYLWVLHRDAVQAPQRAAELAEMEALLAETRAAQRQAPQA